MADVIDMERLLEEVNDLGIPGRSGHPELTVVDLEVNFLRIRRRYRPERWGRWEHIVARHQAGDTFRQLAAELGISSARVFQLYRGYLWRMFNAGYTARGVARRSKTKARP